MIIAISTEAVFFAVILFTSAFGFAYAYGQQDIILGQNEKITEDVFYLVNEYNHSVVVEMGDGFTFLLNSGERSDEFFSKNFEDYTFYFVDKIAYTNSIAPAAVFTDKDNDKQEKEEAEDSGKSDTKDGQQDDSSNNQKEKTKNDYEEYFRTFNEINPVEDDEDKDPNSDENEN